MKQMEKDMKSTMRPHTADKLKQRKGNAMKDFVNVAGPLGISHFIVLSATERCQYVRIGKTPRGPTATFKIDNWASCSDFASALKHYRAPIGAFRHPALLVLSGFKNGGRNIELCSTLFQAMFPTMEVQKMKIAHCQRIVLIQYDKEADALHFRHYAISQNPAGISKSVQKILKRDLPELGHLQDISQYLTEIGYDSENEEAMKKEEATVESADIQKSKGAKQSVVKLHEIGPRLELSLIKIEEGLCEGRVLYHAYVEKTDEEVERLEKQKKEEKDLKTRRKEIQEANVRKKKKIAEKDESSSDDSYSSSD